MLIGKSLLRHRADQGMTNTVIPVIGTCSCFSRAVKKWTLGLK